MSRRGAQTKDEEAHRLQLPGQLKSMNFLVELFDKGEQVS